MDRIGPNMDRIRPHLWTVWTRTYHEIIIPYLTENLRETPLVNPYVTATQTVNDRIRPH